MLEVNKVYCGDNLSLIKQLDNNCIDLTVTSPPYDNLRKYKGFNWDFEGLAKELFRVTKEGGVVVWIVGDATINGSETGTSFKQALYFKEIGYSSLKISNNSDDTLLILKYIDNEGKLWYSLHKLGEIKNKKFELSELYDNFTDVVNFLYPIIEQ